MEINAKVSIDKKPIRSQDDKGKYKRIRTRTDDAFLRDVWDDIGVLPLLVTERLGYPTQNPSLLYTRMIETSSIDGDVVLDPFCGCGTALDAAQALKRKLMFQLEFYKNKTEFETDAWDRSIFICIQVFNSV